MVLSESALCELLETLRTGEAVEVIRESVRMALQEHIEAEASGVIGAARYERTLTLKAMNAETANYIGQSTPGAVYDHDADRHGERPHRHEAGGATAAVPSGHLRQARRRRQRLPDLSDAALSGNNSPSPGPRPARRAGRAAGISH